VGTISVVVVDDHRLVHEAIETVLSAQPDIAIIGRGYRATEAVQLCLRLEPDILIMDVVMPGESSHEAVRTIREQKPEVRIIVLSSHHDDVSVRQMLENGAVAYILKNALLADLVNTIRTVYSGNSVFAIPISTRLIQAYEPHQRVEAFALTGRELEVLKLMSEGLSLAEMATRLVISSSTVKFHITNILQKLDVSTRAEAIVIAAKNNLI
jgi:NarL family two-component system response regulator LiaR